MFKKVSHLCWHWLATVSLVGDACSGKLEVINGAMISACYNGSYHFGIWLVIVVSECNYQFPDVVLFIQADHLLWHYKSSDIGWREIKNEWQTIVPAFLCVVYNI